jgi:ABC-type microcin C transport system duplicated ATPase subunit YejF
MRQRVAIAIALLNRPDVIIADEPTTALDVTIQGQILYEMQKLCRESGTALVWITHDLAVVSGLADEVCVMYAEDRRAWRRRQRARCPLHLHARPDRVGAEPQRAEADPAAGLE